jgi:hypothetical protein
MVESSLVAILPHSGQAESSTFRQVQKEKPRWCKSAWTNCAVEHPLKALRMSRSRRADTRQSWINPISGRAIGANR